MNATEFLRSRSIIGNDKKDLVIGFDDGSQVFLTDILEDYRNMRDPSAMQIKTTHIRVNNATELFAEIAAKLTDKHAAQGNGPVVTDDFEMGGYIWACAARIDTEYKTTEYRDSPPEHEYIMIDVYISVIQCTDKEGNEVDATYFDENGREIGDDELIKMVENLLTEQ